jgi:hypothetical protein
MRRLSGIAASRSIALICGAGGGPCAIGVARIAPQGVDRRPSSPMATTR